jgi:hypothetical protein
MFRCDAKGLDILLAGKQSLEESSPKVKDLARVSLYAKGLNILPREGAGLPYVMDAFLALMGSSKVRFSTSFSVMRRE